MNQHPGKLLVSGAGFEGSLVLVSEDRGISGAFIATPSLIVLRALKKKKKGLIPI